MIYIKMELDSFIDQHLMRLRLRYIAPSVVLGYLYIHTAKDLRLPEGELSVMMYEQRADIVAHRHQR